MALETPWAEGIKTEGLTSIFPFFFIFIFIFFFFFIFI